MAIGNDIFRKEIVQFAAMIIDVCMEMATATLAKAAMNAGLSSLIYVVYYNFLGVLLLLPGFIIQRNRRHPLPLSLPILCKCFILGLLGTCVAMLLGFLGVKYSSPTLGASIGNLLPGFTFVLSMVFRMEKFDPKKTSWQAKSVGTVLSIIGASVMTLYEGPTILRSSTSQSLLSQSSNWVLGGFMLIAAYISAAGYNILQTAVLRNYPEQITVVFFSCCFGSIQSAIVSLLVERRIDAWMLQPGIGITAVVLSAILEPLCIRNITAFCLEMKGPLYVAMFKPLGIFIAAILNLVFLADALRLGSVIGSIIIVVGFYAVMWGMSKEVTMLEPGDILRESGAVNETSSSHMLQK